MKCIMKIQNFVKTNNFNNHQGVPQTNDPNDPLIPIHIPITHLSPQSFNFRIYKLQEDGNAYATVEDLFAAADPKFLPFFKISADDGLRTYVKLSKQTINDVVRSTLRANYGQTTDVHLFLSTSDF